jgi:membrane-associated protein
MPFLLRVWELLRHLDAHIVAMVAQYDSWTYLILSLIVFLENGVVLTPFLPGDSLIFICGSLAAKGSLHPGLLSGFLIIAATLGAFLNYGLGYLAKPYLAKGKLAFIRPSYLQKTSDYFSKYGEITIGIAKFLPIVRTFAPFLAGVSQMSFWTFALYNVLGSVVWILFFVGTGFYFGNIPLIKDNLTLVALAIVAVSVLPVLWRLMRASK